MVTSTSKSIIPDKSIILEGATPRERRGAPPLLPYSETRHATGKEARLFWVAYLSPIWLAATICALLFTAYPANASLALDTPDDQNYTRGTAITTLQLPEATGRGRVTSYTLTGVPSLPPGLNFNRETRRLSGTPQEVGTFLLTYTANNIFSSDSTNTTFTVTVNNSLGLDTPDDQNYARDTAISVQLPAATGGTAPLTYTLTGPSDSALPGGLIFDPDTRTLSGTPSALGSTTLTYRVTDTNDASTSVDFMVTVNNVTVNNSLVLDTPDDQNYMQDKAIPDLELPAATGGTGTLTYTLTGPGDSALPGGLIFDPGTRTLSGTPSALGTTLLTYKVTDTNNASTSVDFMVTVNNSLVLDTPDDQNYMLDTEIPDLELPAATGGTGTLTYTLTGPGDSALPGGLNFTAGTRTLSGTPDTAGSFLLTYTVTDTNNASTSVTFTVSVSEGLVLTASGNRNYAVDRAISGLELPVATGGTAPLTYTLTGPGDSALPGGLIFDPGTRTLSGTPSALGTTTLTYTVTDTNGASTSVDFMVTVKAGLALNTSDDQNYTLDTEITDLELPAATGGTGTLTYTLTGPGDSALPGGLNFTAGTRTLSGTPDTAGSFLLTYTVTDTNNASTSVTFTVSVSEGLALTASGNRNYAVDRAISGLELPVATGGTAPLTYTLTGPGDSALPGGLIFDPGTRTLSGTPSALGTTTLTYKVTDTNGASTSVDFMVTVNNSLVLDTPDDQNYTRGTQTTLQLPAATGGRDRRLVYTLTGLPAGLAFDRHTRTLSGTPSTAGNSILTYRVYTGSSNTSPATFTVTVNNSLGLDTPDDQNYARDTAISVQLPAATGGTAPLTYTLAGPDGLPAGLDFDPGTRTLSGTPNRIDSFSLTYTVTDANDASTNATFTVTVKHLVLDTPDDQNYTRGTAITGLQLQEATGGIGTLVYTLTGPGGDPLPAGLIFNASTRTLSGTPSTAATTALTYTVTDATDASERADFTVTVNNSLGLDTPDDQNYGVDRAISNLILPAATGGTAPLEYTLTAPSGLPPGLIFNPGTRILSGTPSRTGSFLLTYTVTDANNASTNATFTVNNSLVLDTPDHQNYTLNTAILDLQLPATTGGTAALTYTLTAPGDGALPAGLSFNASTRTLSGTPSTAATTILTYTVMDTNNASTSVDFTVTVNNSLVLDAPDDQNYTFDTEITALELPAATGGTAPLTYTLTAPGDSALPGGLTFYRRWLSGTPDTADTTILTYTVTDANDASTTATFTVMVNDGLALTAPANQNYTRGAAILNLQLPVATGGTGTLTYTLTNVPRGLNFNASTRTLSGTPSHVPPGTARTTSPTTYTVTDTNNASTSVRFTVGLNAGLALNTSGNQNYTRGTAITGLQLQEATGGIGTLVYTLTGPGGDPLPAGLSFNASTRTLSGTPSTAGTTNLTYTVMDDNGASTATFTVTVKNLALDTPDDQNYARDTAISVQLPAATGGMEPFTYTLTGPGGDPLPAGLSFNASTRTLSGTPNRIGSFSLTYTVTDANDASTNATFTVTVKNLALDTPDDQNYTRDTAISVQLPAATGGMEPFTYTLTGPDGLPAGLSFNASTRTLSGTPSTAGTTTLTYTVMDDNGASTATFTVTVNNSLGLDTPDDQNYVQEAMTVQLPEATGGTAPLTYTLTAPGGLPGSLEFDASTRTLSGRPNRSSGFSLTLTYTVTDANDASRNATFMVTVSRALHLGLATGNQNYTQFTAIPDLPLGRAYFGIGTLVYTLTGLPPGLSFNASTRTLSGTPSTAGTFDLTHTVTDATGASTSVGFRVRVSSPLLNTLILNKPADKNYTLDMEITDLQLPVATGGTGTLTYTLTGLPAGLIFDPGTRTLSGTPSTAGTTTLTYRVSDTSDVGTVTFSTTFTVTVNAGLALNTSGNQNYMRGTAILNLQLPAATGGTGTLTYTLTGLPAGLIFDPGTRTLSGTPSRTGTTALIYTATETNGASRNATFTVTVNADLGLDTPAHQSYTLDTAIPDLQLPAATGGTAPLTYTLTALGGLPAGLSFNASTRTLSGTPSAVAITALIYKVTDANNASRNATFTVTVNSTRSIFVLNKPTDKNYTRGIAITNLQLPAATGSTAPLTYTLTAPGGLPAGLSFNASTRTLSGTPSTAGTTTLTYRVSDTNGASTNMTFRVTVNAGLALNTSGNQNYLSQRLIPDLTLPAATGGAGTLAYTLTSPGGLPAYTLTAPGGLPAGLSFNASTRTLSGRHTEGITILIYTVTDANGASANATFTVRVTNPQAFTTRDSSPGNQSYTLDTAIPDLQLPAATIPTISLGIGGGGGGGRVGVVRAVAEAADLHSDRPAAGSDL